MVTIRKRWRLRALMGLIVLAGLVMAFLRELPNLGPVYRLRYADPPGRMSAAVQLGMLGPKKGNFAEPALLAALNDPDQGVCDCAAWALDQFGSTDPALVKALVKQVEVETEESLRWRWQGAFYQRVDPFKTLGRIKPTASTLAPLLGKAMSSPDPWLRLRAANLLREAIRWSGGPTPDVSPLLLTTLRDEEPTLRFELIDELANSDDQTRRAAVAILLQRLQSPNPQDVFEATVALSRFGPEAGPAVKILADRLQEGDLADRLGTLFLLGKLGPTAKPAVPAILRALTASDAGKNKPGFLDQFWRRSSGWNLINERIFGPEDRSHMFDSVRVYGVRVLGRINHEAERQGIGFFVEMLGADTIEARRTALESLATFGPKASSAIPALIHLAEGLEVAPSQPDDSNLAYLTFKTIHEVGSGDDPLLVEALVRMLKSKGGDQRARAVYALQYLKPPPRGVVPDLVAAVKDPNPVVRRCACDALGRHLGSEGEPALQALLAAMGDPDVWVRINAGQSLASRGGAAAEAIPPLIRLLRTEDRNLRSQAAQILGKFGPSARVASAALLVALDDEMNYVRKSAEEALNAVSPIESKTADEALEALRQGDISRRLAAVRDLVRPGSTAQQEIPSKIRVEALRMALGDPDPIVCATAAAGLGRLGRQAEEAAPALLATMKDERPEVRVQSATALGRVAPGDEKAIETLGLALAGDPDVDVRNAAASGLGWMGPQATVAAPVMIRALNDPDETVRVHVIVALGRIGPADGSVATALKTIAERDPSTEFRIWAIRALGLIGGKSNVVVPTLLMMLDDANGNIRYAAAYQLGMIRPTGEVLPALLGRLNEGKPPARSLAAGTLGMLGPEVATEVLPALIRALRDEDEEVRKGAVKSLMMLGEAAASAAPALRQALNDRCPAIRSDAELALQCIAGEAGVGFFGYGAW
jgi:HEAT repeat protein